MVCFVVVVPGFMFLLISHDFCFEHSAFDLPFVEPFVLLLCFSGVSSLFLLDSRFSENFVNKAHFSS